MQRCKPILSISFSDKAQKGIALNTGTQEVEVEVEIQEQLVTQRKVFLKRRYLETNNTLYPQNGKDT